MGFGGSPRVPRPKPPPGRSAAEVQEAELLERRRRALARGRASTILTQFGAPLTGTVSKKTLLGE